MAFMPGLNVNYEGMCEFTNMYSLSIMGLSSSNPDLCKRMYHQSELVIFSWVKKLKEAANDWDFN